MWVLLWLVTIALLDALLIAHECGHYLVACAFRIRVERFTIGFGSTSVERTSRAGTTWRIGRFPLGAFVRILFPLVGPGLVATSIFAFIQAWNEYIIAYVLLSSAGKQTLTIWLADFTTGTTRGVDWGTLMAAATLTALPVIIFFVLVHRRIAFGLTAGAVRG